MRVRVHVSTAGEKIDDEKKSDAGDEVNPQRMNVTGTLAFDKFIR